MAGHNLQITLKSANQIDSITVSDEAVDLLMPGNPAQTVEQARGLVLAALVALLNQRRNAIVDRFQETNVTVST